MRNSMQVSLKTENGTCFLFFYLQVNWAVYFTLTYSHSEGLPSCLSGKESACQCKRCGFDPWVGKIPWSRKWQLTSVLLPRKSTDRGTWWATVLGVAKNWTQLNPHKQARTVILKNGISVGSHFTFVDLHSLYRTYWNIQIYVATISWLLFLQILDSFKSPY